MTILERYLAYADAFEATYEDGDWTRLEEFFTDDAVYETNSPDSGREEAIPALKASVEGFDRRMDERLPDFAPPSVDGRWVTMKWKVTYKKAGLPDIVLSGSETAEFRGTRIAALRAKMDPEAQAALQEWMIESAQGVDD